MRRSEMVMAIRREVRQAVCVGRQQSSCWLALRRWSTWAVTTRCRAKNGALDVSRSTCCREARSLPSGYRRITRAFLLFPERRTWIASAVDIETGGVQAGTDLFPAALAAGGTRPQGFDLSPTAQACRSERVDSNSPSDGVR